MRRLLEATVRGVIGAESLCVTRIADFPGAGRERLR
jgi:hypothetical protein